VPPDRFLLVAGAAGGAWLEAASAIDRPPLSCVAIGREVPDPDGAWSKLLEIEPDGAILVRPDQHVAWRAHGEVVNPRATLRGVFARILGS
jgi:2,4-dichlorophenol 6-monooxygenase